MSKNNQNDDVYEFLTEECQHYPDLWKEYGEGILSHIEDVEFWNSLSNYLDCFRVCDECGKPMIEGFVFEAGEHYCSEECLYKHVSPEQYIELYDNGEGDSYWTTWYEDSVTWRENARGKAKRDIV